MCWKRIKRGAQSTGGRWLQRWWRRSTLWQRLALWLLPALLLVMSLELWMTRQDALAAANAAYDRSLLGALKSIDANISTASGGLSVELPYRMFEFFELTASGQVFFRVATSDGLVELGSADLPEPAQPPDLATPVFYDAVYFGEPLRVAAYRRALGGVQDAPSQASVLLQIGESTRSRQEFSDRFVRGAMRHDALVLLLLLSGSAVVLMVALRPLARLAREVQSRSANDLTHIDDGDLPADVRPLVAAVNQQMRRSQELIAVQREFLDDASHQLRTHLTTLQMQVDYARRTDDAGQVRTALDALANEIGRATRSAQQLLALGRSDTAAVAMVPVDLQALLRAVALQWLPQARAKRIDLGLQPSAAPALVAVGDPGLLHEALSNLVANAIAYTPVQGSITLSATADAHDWSLQVEDSGPGLTEAERAALGQRFRRGANAGQGGFGLGLSIVRTIAQRHGGRLLLAARSAGPGLHAMIVWPCSTAAADTVAAP
ncbi:sensor histidine kinase [Comamonas aquatica]|uniref:sensor histidine kinase n=1 Tax=Comamonas aquatica TaxID=225991 RepID=UPI0021B0EE30|nr:sensor histidine kinase [Comamonas aquatica]